LVITTTELRQARADVQAEDAATETQRRTDIQNRLNTVIATEITAFNLRIPTGNYRAQHTTALSNIRFIEQKIIDERTNPDPIENLGIARITGLKAELTTRLNAFNDIRRQHAQGTLP